MIEQVPGTLSDPLYVKARQAYAIFYEEKRKRVGLKAWRQPVYFERDHYRKRFYQIAEICTRNGWDIEMYIKSVFDALNKNHNTVLPCDFTNDKAVGNYRLKVFTGTVTSNPRNRYENQVRKLLDMLGRLAGGGATEFSVLMDALAPFEAWFRVVYPEQFNEELFIIYGNTAYDELREDSNLRAFVRQMFPKAMLELEERLGFFGDGIRIAHNEQLRIHT